MEWVEVRIAQQLYQQMVEHGYNSLPNEACGIASGKDGQIEQVWPLVNERPSPHRFFVSKSIVSSTLEAIEQSGSRCWPSTTHILEQHRCPPLMIFKAILTPW